MPRSTHPQGPPRAVDLLSSNYGFWIQSPDGAPQWPISWLFTRNHETRRAPDLIKDTGLLIPLRNAKGESLSLLSLGKTAPDLQALSGDWEVAFGAVLNAKRGRQTASVLGFMRCYGDISRRLGLLERMIKETEGPSIKVDLGNAVTNRFFRGATESLANELFLNPQDLQTLQRRSTCLSRTKRGRSTTAGSRCCRITWPSARTRITFGFP